MRILGHRGASADFPENTLEAFSGAIAQRADGVELDVMRCASGELVVCHDEWLDRLAGLHWEVLTTPWWKLKGVDVGSRLGFAPARIPLSPQRFGQERHPPCRFMPRGGITKPKRQFARNEPDGVHGRGHSSGVSLGEP